MSVKKAMEKYLNRQLDQVTPKPKRKNKSPEKDMIELLIPVLRQCGYDVDIFESKATYSVAAGRYLRGNLPVGFPDIAGNNARGMAVYIEAKAPGLRGNLSDEQREFLINKIKKGCLVMVVDSIESFEKQHKQFEDTYYLFSQDQRAELLLKALPPKKKLSRDASPF